MIIDKNFFLIYAVRNACICSTCSVGVIRQLLRLMPFFGGGGGGGGGGVVEGGVRGEGGGCCGGGSEGVNAT